MSIKNLANKQHSGPEAQTFGKRRPRGGRASKLNAVASMWDESTLPTQLSAMVSEDAVDGGDSDAQLGGNCFARRAFSCEAQHLVGLGARCWVAPSDLNSARFSRAHSSSDLLASVVSAIHSSLMQFEMASVAERDQVARFVATAFVAWD